ncbi:DNA-binding protein [Marinobacterium weihaiense]|uniref:DNA-binding protein n=1 Tax=Marinobacterium weihaiense TaxID=2851016 RepID=A0ABS6M7C4_9GAMM|nr:DNA-binding protein [Marinobacterium weihaiense]MBV0932140.1 DNA-binding protein [Marinobacterium weihaiense]
MDKQLKADIFAAADQCLLSGRAPSASRLSRSLECIADIDLEAVLEEWWYALSGRIRFGDARSVGSEMPESMRQAFGRIWQQAVQEATEEVRAEHLRTSPVDEQAVRERDEAVKRSQAALEELEQRYREQELKLDQSQERVQSLEADLTAVRQELAGQTTLHVQEKQRRQNAEQELEQLRKAHEDTKRVFDQRVRDEKRHSLEALAKVDVDMRHYRNALEKLRDESGRKEAELTREMHELQSRLAQRDARVEAMNNQLRSQDDAINVHKSSDAQQQREVARLGAQLLSETNRSKRCEEQLRTVETQLTSLKQKHAGEAAEYVRRENQLRAQLKERDEALQKAQVRAKGLEERCDAIEEEMRRLKQRPQG